MRRTSVSPFPGKDFTSVSTETDEDREMGNFVRVLTLLIQEDAFCRDCVEIIDE